MAQILKAHSPFNMKKQNIFLIGIFVFGLAHYGIEKLMGGGVTFVVLMMCILYCLARAPIW